MPASSWVDHPVSNRTNFAFETTLGAATIPRLLSQAAAKGADVRQLEHFLGRIEHMHLPIVAGIWPLVWDSQVKTPASQKFADAFTKKYGKPPENQAWGDYMSTRHVAQAMNEIKSTDSSKLAEHLEKGAKFDVLSILAQNDSGPRPRMPRRRRSASMRSSATTTGG